MIYKYFILVIVIIFLAIVLNSQPNYIYNKIDNNVDYFDQADMPITDNIILLSLDCAKKLVPLTFDYVIIPCARTNINTTKICVSGYMQYYNLIIDPILQMYSKLKKLEGVNIDNNSALDTWEQYRFVVAMVNSYSRALSDATTYIVKSYGNEGFFDKISPRIFDQYLVNYMTDDIVKLYSQNIV